MSNTVAHFTNLCKLFCCEVNQIQMTTGYSADEDKPQNPESEESGSELLEEIIEEITKSQLRNQEVCL